MVLPLNELEIGMVAIAFTLIVFAVQGLISVALEGQQLHLGRTKPRLTNLLTVAIVVFALLLVVIALLLGTAIVSNWKPYWIGLLAGLGSIDLALLLVFYKEGFVGDEACFDDREDGVPW